MEDEGLSNTERQHKPYTVLVSPDGLRGVAYNAQHRVMAPEASAKLLAWAKANHTRQAAWEDKLDEHWQRERAPWMPTGSLAGWTMYWLRDGKTGDAQIRATPSR